MLAHLSDDVESVGAANTYLVGRQTTTDFEPASNAIFDFSFSYFKALTVVPNVYLAMGFKAYNIHRQLG